MMNVNEAAAASKLALEKMTEELQAGIQKCIDSAILQGSVKTTFYPRNQFESDHAIALLESYGYAVEVKPAKDQRDRDCINISWG